MDALAGDAEAWWGVPHLLQRRMDWCLAPAGHCRRRCWRSCGRFGNPSIRGGSGLARIRSDEGDVNAASIMCVKTTDAR